MNSILKSFLIKYFPAIIFFIIKNFFGLDFINDFNPFTSETKEYFNGNSGEEGEGSNRQNNNDNNDNNDNNNNNTPNQDSSINPEEVKEVEGGVVVSGETFEEAKALYKENSESFVK